MMFLCVLFLGLVALSSGIEVEVNTFKKSVVEASASQTVVNAVKSSLQCASICQNEPACASSSLTGDVCSLNLKSVDSCIYKSNPANPVTVFQKTEVGNSGITLPPGETAQPYLITTAEEKSLWLADSSMPIRGGNFASFAIDGQHILSGESYYHSWTTGMSWMMIKMDKEHWVKGVKMISRDLADANFRHNFKEVRVGNTDVSGAGEDELLCQNQLCYRTGSESNYQFAFDCASPLKGQYLTIQKYLFTGDHNVNEFIEIDVEVYCGAFLSNDGSICEAEEVEACSRMPTGTEVTASSQAAKSGWVLTASSPNGDNFPSNAVDGDRTGLALGQTNVFCTHNYQSGDTFPWLQVDFGLSKSVKAVHLYSRTEGHVGEQITYTEVRVGDFDAGAVTLLGSRICMNALCKTTGAALVTAHTEDCSSPPLEGRYVTMQRTMDYASITYPALCMAEVDIVFYE